MRMQLFPANGSSIMAGQQALVNLVSNLVNSMRGKEKGPCQLLLAGNPKTQRKAIKEILCVLDEVTDSQSSEGITANMTKAEIMCRGGGKEVFIISNGIKSRTDKAHVFLVDLLRGENAKEKRKEADRELAEYFCGTCGPDEEESKKPKKGKKAEKNADEY